MACCRCSGCCQCYVFFGVIVTLFFGVILFGILGWMIFVDPFATRDFSAISDFAIIEIFLGCSVLFLFVAAFFGYRFQKFQGRVMGVIYLLLLVAALGLQFFSAGHIFASNQRLNSISDLLNQNVTTMDEEHSFIRNARARTMLNSWNNFHSSVEHFKCNFTDPLRVTQSFVDTLQYDTQYARALQEWETPAFVRCASTGTDIACSDGRFFQSVYNNFCMGSGSDDDMDAFEEGCTECTNKYVELWLNETTQEERNEFYGDTGIMYCRCLTRFLSTAENNARTITILLVVYIIFNVLLIFSAIWILIVGPPPPPGQDDYNAGAGPAYGGEELPAYSETGEMLVQVQCPYDSGPGGWVLVTAPNGKSAEVIVPPTVGPGMLFQVYI